MTKPSRGIRHRTRNSMRQKPYMRPPITKFLKQYKEGQKVIIMQEPSSQKGMPHPRFRGVNGYIIGKRGKSYIIQIQDSNKQKKIISKSEHLKIIQEVKK